MAQAASNERVLDIREMSFQNVIDQILKPNGVKVGGFPDEMFVDMSEEEQAEVICNICYMVVNEPQQCANKHLFCEACIFAWTMTYGENSQKCPVCRVDQKKYRPNTQIKLKLQDRRVNCPVDKCEFSACLKAFLMHNHGKERFSNAGVNLEELRPARPDGARLLVLPNITLQPGTRSERAQSIRDQISQGRMMIHQMMLLLHLEMQLRQQALVSYSQATDPEERLQRLDEVMALNEQLSEVGGVLSTLLNSPISRIIESTGALSAQASAAGPSSSSDGRVSQMLRLAREREGLSDPESSSSSEDEYEASSLRYGSEFRDSRPRVSVLQRGNVAHGPLTTGSSSGAGFNVSIHGTRNTDRNGPALRDAARSNTRDDLLDIPSMRALSDNSQAGAPMTEIHPRVLLGRSTSRPNENTRNTSNTEVVQETTTSVLSTNQSTNSNTSSTGIANSTFRSTPALPTISSAANPSTQSSPTDSAPARRTTVNRDAAVTSRAPISRDDPVPPRATAEQAPNSIAATARLLSGRIRAQPENTLASANSSAADTSSIASTSNPTSNPPSMSNNTNVTTTAARERPPVTYQSANNAGNIPPTTTRERASNAMCASQGPSMSTGPVIGPAIDVESVPQASTTPRFEQRNTFRVAQQQSSSTTSRAGSASRRSNTHAISAARGTSEGRPRYAPRIKQNASNNQSTNRSTERRPSDTSSSSTNNNASRMSRARDTTNRLSNASYRRNNSTNNSQGDNTGSGSQTGKAPANQTAARRPSNGNGTIIPRGPSTAGQLIRARRRSEIQKELAKFREDL